MIFGHLVDICLYPLYLATCGDKIKDEDFSWKELLQHLLALAIGSALEWSILVGQEASPTTLEDSRARNLIFGNLVDICLYPLVS